MSIQAIKEFFRTAYGGPPGSRIQIPSQRGIGRSVCCRPAYFGESHVQEMTQKYETLPKDIEWHFIGHLQTNKVKYMAPYVAMIHAIDSYKLLVEVNKQASKVHRVIPCLLQIHIAQEETKFGFLLTNAGKCWIQADGRI